MNHNPYTPPQAPVSDAAEVSQPAQKPKQVSMAAQMLWATLALGVINTALQWKYLMAVFSVEMLVVTQLLTLGIAAWLTIKISAGRNWARITYLVLTIVGLPAILLQLPATFARAPVSGLVGGVQLVLQLYALYLIFFEPGRRWFRRSSSLR